MWDLDYKESWGLKNWCFWTVVLEKTLESSLDCKEIQPVYPKGDQSWVFTGRTDVEAETPILWPPDAKNWLIGKDPDAGKRLKAGGEGDDRGWDGWMASLIQWTWVCASCGRWWWTGRPGMLRSMGSQRAGHDWATELNWVLKNPPTNCRRHGRSWFDSWVRKVPWRRKGPPTPVFLLGESHGQRSPAGYSLWGHKGSDVTKCMCVCVHIDTIISPKWVWICSLNMGETEN